MARGEVEVAYNRMQPISHTQVTRFTDGSAKIVIGTKGATKEQVARTLRHEKLHLKERYKVGTKIWQTVYKRAQAELKAYSHEKKNLSASGWNRIVNTRIRDFLTYFDKLTPSQKKAIKPRALRILRKRKI